MLTGNCHCGEVGWSLASLPESATTCNCTVCRRYGVLWAYGYLGDDVRTTGETGCYRRHRDGDTDFHFCTTCGCVTHYITTAPEADGRVLAAVNLRMADPEQIKELPVERFEGLHSFDYLPDDGSTVRDKWF